MWNFSMNPIPEPLIYYESDSCVQGQYETSFN